MVVVIYFYNSVYALSLHFNNLCVDINECESDVHQCDNNTYCVNEVGGYMCACNSGYSGTGENCSKYFQDADYQADNLLHMLTSSFSVCIIIILSLFLCGL